jgi:hypothetical protein
MEEQRMDEVPSVYSIFIAAVPAVAPFLFPSLGIFPESYFIFTLPLLILAIPLATLYFLLAYARRDRLYRYKLAGALLVFLAAVVVVCRVSMRVLPFAKRWRNGRHSAFPDALNLVKGRLQSGRMLRQARYDLYLPPSDAFRVSDNLPKLEIPMGLVLVPGALVDHNAYVRLAVGLSDQGILVALLNLEPYRLAVRHLGAGPRDIQAILRQISEHTSVDSIINVKKIDPNLVMSNGIEVKEWSIGGHSQGALAASKLAKPLGINNLVLIAMSIMPTNQSKENLNTLVILASNDGYLFLRQTREKFRSMLPSSTTYHMIEGGNHAGFAHYGPQIKDGERTIPLEEQQNSCITTVANFLNKECGHQKEE